jgi:hypothetical protein
LKCEPLHLPMCNGCRTPSFDRCPASGQIRRRATERDQLLAEIVALTTQRDQEQATASKRAGAIQRLMGDIVREQDLAGAAQVDAAAARLPADLQVDHLEELRVMAESLSAVIETGRAARTAAERDAAVAAAATQAKE